MICKMKVRPHPLNLLLRPRQPLDPVSSSFLELLGSVWHLCLSCCHPLPCITPGNSCASFDTQPRCHCFGEVFPDLPKTEVMSPITSAAMLPFQSASLDVRSLKAEDAQCPWTSLHPAWHLPCTSPPGTSITWMNAWNDVGFTGMLPGMIKE